MGKENDKYLEKSMNVWQLLRIIYKMEAESIESHQFSAFHFNGYYRVKWVIDDPLLWRCPVPAENQYASAKMNALNW